MPLAPARGDSIKPLGVTKEILSELQNRHSLMVTKVVTRGGGGDRGVFSVRLFDVIRTTPVILNEVKEQMFRLRST